MEAERARRLQLKLNSKVISDIYWEEKAVRNQNLRFLAAFLLNCKSTNKNF